MSDVQYEIPISIDEEMQLWLEDDMSIFDRWSDISKTMTGIANSVMVQDMRNRFNCEHCMKEENEQHDIRIQFYWQLTKRRYACYREQFMQLDFDNEDRDKNGKMHRDILERALAQDAESIIFGSEVEF